MTIPIVAAQGAAAPLNGLSLPPGNPRRGFDFVKKAVADVFRIGAECAAALPHR